MVGIALVILEIILETNSTHGFILAICLNPVGFDGQRFNGTGNLFEQGVHASNLFKPITNSWEVTRFDGQSFNGTWNLIDPWVHPRNLFNKLLA